MVDGNPKFKGGRNERRKKTPRKASGIPAPIYHNSDHPRNARRPRQTRRRGRPVDRGVCSPDPRAIRHRLNPEQPSPRGHLRAKIGSPRPNHRRAVHSPAGFKRRSQGLTKHERPLDSVYLVARQIYPWINRFHFSPCRPGRRLGRDPERLEDADRPTRRLGQKPIRR